MAVIDTGRRTPEALGGGIGEQDFSLFTTAHNMRLLLREISANAAAARRQHVRKQALADIILENLRSNLSTLEADLKAVPPATWVLPTQHPYGAPEVAHRALVDDYGVDYGEDSLAIPSSNITAWHILEYASTPGMPLPQLVARIKTSIDKPSHYFTAPGELSAVPSPGSWFHVPLEGLTIDFLPDVHA